MLKAKYKTLYDKIQAWRVWSVLLKQNEDSREAWRGLAIIAPAPAWLHNALANQMIESCWTNAATRDKVSALKDVAEPPVWADFGKVADAVISGQMRINEVAKLAYQYQTYPQANVPVDNFSGFTMRDFVLAGSRQDSGPSLSGHQVHMVGGVPDADVPDAEL